MRIVWTRPACSDLESIRDYIARDSEYYAARYVGRILEAVDILKKFPEIGESVLHVEGKEIRQLIFQNHRILYQVQADHVVVLAVIHAPQRSDFARPKALGRFMNGVAR